MKFCWEGLGIIRSIHLYNQHVKRLNFGWSPQVGLFEERNGGILGFSETSLLKGKNILSDANREISIKLQACKVVKKGPV